MVRGIRINRLAVRALKSATAGLVLAIVAAGAADNVDLPDELQLLVSQLDIASYFPMVANFANPITAFVLWTLPINALFYGPLVFAYLSWGAYRGRVDPLPPRDSLASAPTAPSAEAVVPSFPEARQGVSPVSTEALKGQMHDRAAQVGLSPFLGGLQAANSITAEPLTEHGESHPAALAWKRLLSDHWEVAAIERLTRGKRKSRPVYRLRGPHGETVIAKRCREDKAQVERMIYQELMPRVLLPSLKFYGLLEDPGTEFCWLFLEDVAVEPYSPKLAPHRALAGGWLGEVHVASLSTNLQGRLPSREPGYYLGSLRSSRAILVDHLDHNTAMVPDDSEVFGKVVADFNMAETHWSEIEEICAVMPRTLVHGDFVAKNVRVRTGSASRTLLVFDWEFAGWGVPAADLAQFGEPEHLVNPDLGIYCSVLKRVEPRLSLGEIQAVAACGSLFRLVDVTGWAIGYLRFGSRDHLVKTVETLRSYEPALAKALEILKGVLA